MVSTEDALRHSYNLYIIKHVTSSHFSFPSLHFFSKLLLYVIP